MLLSFNVTSIAMILGKHLLEDHSIALALYKEPLVSDHLIMSNAMDDKLAT